MKEKSNMHLYTAIAIFAFGVLVLVVGIAFIVKATGDDFDKATAVANGVKADALTKGEFTQAMDKYTGEVGALKAQAVLDKEEMSKLVETKFQQVQADQKKLSGEYEILKARHHGIEKEIIKAAANKQITVNLPKFDHPIEVTLVRRAAPTKPLLPKDNALPETAPNPNVKRQAEPLPLLKRSGVKK